MISNFQTELEAIKEKVTQIATGLLEANRLIGSALGD